MKFVVDDDTFQKSVEKIRTLERELSILKASISKSDSEDDINNKICSKSNYKGTKKFKRQENPEGITKSNETFLLEIEEENLMKRKIIERIKIIKRIFPLYRISKYLKEEKKALLQIFLE